MSEPTSATAHYRVEVSGWDAQGAFFAEKTTLEWDASGGKRILLRSRVGTDAVVFVRLLDPTGRQAIPVVYHVLGVGRADSCGACEILIAPVRQNSVDPPPDDSMFTKTTTDKD
ncbi:MAG: hypothetical protein K6U02_10860 [Firmicutes bacterium]|nr:hypothetical protein [Bacillota bacterium]